MIKKLLIILLILAVVAGVVLLVVFRDKIAGTVVDRATTGDGSEIIPFNPLPSTTEPTPYIESSTSTSSETTRETSSTTLWTIKPLDPSATSETTSQGTTTASTTTQVDTTVTTGSTDSTNLTKIGFAVGDPIPEGGRYYVRINKWVAEEYHGDYFPELHQEDVFEYCGYRYTYEATNYYNNYGEWMHRDGWECEAVDQEPGVKLETISGKVVISGWKEVRKERDPNETTTVTQVETTIVHGHKLNITFKMVLQGSANVTTLKTLSVEKAESYAIYFPGNHNPASVRVAYNNGRSDQLAIPQGFLVYAIYDHTGTKVWSFGDNGGHVIYDVPSDLSGDVFVFVIPVG